MRHMALIFFTKTGQSTLKVGSNLLQALEVCANLQRQPTNIFSHVKALRNAAKTQS
jgi:hypothetical protein